MLDFLFSRDLAQMMGLWKSWDDLTGEIYGENCQAGSVLYHVDLDEGLIVSSFASVVECLSYRGI
jgi:hypothetical protein